MKLLKILLLAIFFLPALSAQAYLLYPSQCSEGQESGQQLNCTNDNDPEILENECNDLYNPDYCASMPAYLSHMAQECNRVKPDGINCNLIPQKGIYGREASKYAAYVRENTRSAAVTTTPSSNTGTNTSADALSLFPNPAGGIKGVLAAVINWMLGIIGVIAIIGFIISGLQYFFAAGNESKVETAKKNITYSIIGIVIALSGLVITRAIQAALNAASF